jgi:Fur family transcriptional regulator, ferric uptake regulator
MTLTRQVIIDALDSSDDYLSAEDLYLLVRQEYPGIGVATVYRTLQLLEELFLVHRIETGEGKARYAMNREEAGQRPEEMSEVLLVCDSCGKVIRSPGGLERGEALFQEIADHGAAQFHFHPFRKTLQIHGLCSACYGGGEAIGAESEGSTAAADKAVDEGKDEGNGAGSGSGSEPEPGPGPGLGPGPAKE